MSNEVQLFGGKGLAVSGDLLDKARGISDKLVTSSGPRINRISIRGGRFRQVVAGEEVNVSKDDTLNVIIVDAAPISRQYYKGTYDAKNPTPPACWSHDTKVPADDVEEPQAPNCLNCPNNVKGSGQGKSRACRFSQRIAVVLEGDLEKVYQMSLPATSIFGDLENGNMPMGAYAKLLKANDAPVQAVVTAMTFDEDAETPKLFFSPARPATEEEFTAVMDLQENSDEVKLALELTVAQADGVETPATEAKVPAKPKPKPKAKPKPKPKSEEPELDEEDVEEPVLSKSSAQEEPPEDPAVADALDEWDDEDD